VTGHLSRWDRLPSRLQQKRSIQEKHIMRTQATNLRPRLAWAASALLLVAGHGAWAEQLTIDPSQVALDGAGSSGPVGRLVDEQAIVGDPRAGSQVKPTSNWNSTSGTHVNAAIIDLGAEYRLDRIYIFDANGAVGGSTGNFTISSGSAASGWTVRLEDDLGIYEKWKGFPNDTGNDGNGFVDDPSLEYTGVTTRYLRVVNPTGQAAVREIVVYGSPLTSTPTDVARHKPASASSEYQEGTEPPYAYPNPAPLAVDGSDTTYWASSQSALRFTYLEVELGAYYSLSRFDLELGHATGGAPAAFEMQVQNQGCWKTVPGTAVTGNPGGGRTHSFVVSPEVVTNRIRLVCPGPGGSCRVRTLAALGVPSTASAAAPPVCEVAGQVAHRSPAYDYAEFVPVGYDDDPDEKFPLVIALHGWGGAVLTSDHTAVLASPEGLARQLDEAAFANFPAVVVSPHCRALGATSGNCTFDQARLEALWRDVMSTYRVDRDRVYMTGLSRGALATLRFASSHAQDLAAIVPICGNLGLAPNELECNMKDLPVFAAHGTKDPTVPVRDLFALQTKLNTTCNPAHDKTAIRVMVNAAHGIWNPVYSDQRVYDWLFAQRASAKAEDATHHWPVVTTSGNQTLSLGGASTVTATVSGSATHPDGADIATYAWLNVTTINSVDELPTVKAPSSSPDAQISGLTQGTHRFRLVATDERGFSGYKDLTITVTP
jgi:poly(3-hydroxybutyrate) depolymerase